MTVVSYTPRQQAANRKKWIKALRSGKYKQGKGYLHIKGEKQDSFCCLGVACDLALKAGVELKTQQVTATNKDDEVQVMMYDHEQGELPEEVQKWLGLATVCGTFSTKNGFKYLTSLNDGDDPAGIKGKSFKQISNIIEKHEKSLTTIKNAL
jgi:hypothetical protein